MTRGDSNAWTYRQMERLTEIPFDVVADALQGGSDISLAAACHDVIWTATELELEQIHEYFAAVLLAEPQRERSA